MLAIPRAVTDGERTWSGRANPIRIGPTTSASVAAASKVSATLAQDELAAEKLRRAEWARTVANAQNFEASRELQIGDVPADAERRPIKPKE